MANFFDQFDESQPAGNFFDQFDAPKAPDRKTFAIDWAKPSTEIRAAISKLPEADRHDAINQWAEAQVTKERAGPTTLTNNPIAEGVRHFGRGTLMGSFLDEIDAKGNAAIYNVSGGRIGVPEEEALAYNRARSRAEDEAHPIAGTVGKLAGGFASGAPVAKAVIGGAKSGVGKLAASGLAGGTAASVYGFGEGEGGVKNRLDSANEAAPYGLAFGVGLPIAGSLAKGAAQKIADHIPALKARLPISKISDPEAVADATLAGKLKRAGQTPEGIQQDFAEGEAASRLNSNSELGKNGKRGKAQPWATDVARSDEATHNLLPEMLADTSDSMQRLTGSVYRTGNEAGDLVKSRLESRQRGPENPYSPRPDETPRGQIDRMIDAFDRALLIKSKGTARQTERDITKAQKAKGDELYTKAREGGDAFDLQPAIDAHTHVMMQYKGPDRAVLQRALDLFVDPMNKQWSVNNIRRFDLSKRQLDDLIEGSKDMGRATNLTRELKGFKDSLLAKVHEGGKNKVYQEARDTWGSHAEMKEAIDLGRAALRENSEVSIEQFRELSKAQQKLFRIGMRESLRNAIGRLRPGHDATKLFDTRRVQELLAEVIPATEAKSGVFADRPQRFGEIMRREQRMSETGRKVLGNSATAERVQDDAEFASDALASIVTSGRSVLNYGLEFLGAGLQKAFGYRRDVALAYARRLTETDPVKRAEAMRRIAKKMGPSRFAQFAKQLGDVAGMGSAPAAISGAEPATSP